MASAADLLRHDWTPAEIDAIYSAPLPDLVFRAQTVHRANHRPDLVQGCMRLSIKTGGCPSSQVRLSAGRLALTDEAQARCFVAGANSMFRGERLLTTPNPGATHDTRLLERLGMRLTPTPLGADRGLTPT
jgi:biotin synthase